MIPPFRVWDDDGQTKEDAIEIVAVDAHDAAEIFAERAFDNGDPFNSIDLHVLGADEDEAEFRVEVDFSLNFHATQGVSS